MVFATMLCLFSFSAVPVLANDLLYERKETLDDTNEIAYIGGAQLSYTFSGWGFRSTLSKINFRDGTNTAIPGPWGGKDTIVSKVQLSQNGSYLALILKQRNQGGSLQLLSTADEDTIYKVADRVVFYDWSPNSEYIVYVKEDTMRTKPLGASFMPQGVYVYSIGTKEHRKIAQEAYQLIWARHDNHIYIDKNNLGNLIVRIEPESGKQTMTDYKDLNFSPTGAFYCHVVVEREVMTHPEIVSSKNNKVIRNFYKEANDSSGMLGCQWTSETEVSFQATSSHFVYDAMKKKIIRLNLNKRTGGKFIRNNYYPVAFSQKNKFVAYRNGYWELQDVLTGKVYKKVRNTLFKERKN